MAGSNKKLYSIVLVEDGTGRNQRKARERAALQVITREHAEQRATEKAKLAAEREEARSKNYLPRSGEPGPAGLRSYRRFRVPAHQDTSAALQGAYPFLAEGGLGSGSVRRARHVLWRIVHLRPVGALPAGHHYRRESRACGHRRFREVLAREEPVHQVDPVRQARVCSW